MHYDARCRVHNTQDTVRHQQWHATPANERFGELFGTSKELPLEPATQVRSDLHGRSVARIRFGVFGVRGQLFALVALYLAGIEYLRL